METCQSRFTTKQCLQFHYRKAHGLSEDQMPKIEREIPYTLTAYSGGIVKEDQNSAGNTQNNNEINNLQGGSKEFPR